MSGDERTDAALLASARSDDRAFAILVRRYVRAATMMATQLVGDPDEAEDVVQDAFTIVFRKANAFESGRPFGPWLFAIVRRLASNRIARTARRARLLRLWGRSASAEASAPSVDDAIFARLDADAASRATEDLSPMQRACFELVAIRGLSPAEVAAMHDISESTVRQHVFRARAALRLALDGPQAEQTEP